MKRLTRFTLGLAFVGATLSFVPSIHAVNTTLDIKVSITGSKALNAGTTTYDYGSQSVNISSVSSALAITNTSTAFLETYTIQGANAASTGGGTTWTLASSTGPDQYALAAQFSSAQPTNVDASWASDDTTTSAIPCDTTTFGNGTPAESGAAVVPSAVRKLWFRLKTPNAVTDTTQRLAIVTVAVQ